MASKVTMHLTALLIHAEIPRSSTPATGFEQPQQITHELRASRGWTTHRVPDTNDGIDETSRHGRLRHPSTLPDRYLEFSITCRFHGNAQWRHIRDTSPSEWADVVEFDAAIRQGNARANATGNRLLGEAFLHRSRVPLSEAPIDHVTAAERAALRISADEADVLENGVEDGCSPWACRGDADALTRDDFGLAT
ncbi:hypothetical protein ACFW4M_07540 [Streptomyces sp. NPDC058794]|uniref:hypothetical protein n=2 Tax=Streptomyces TaxID=1883 RepID=UPI0022BA141C|nr:hypothetical protein [Streptomyces mutabilis]MCZ9354113.1 hypothetical protein [Streptomyces mutabilis]